VLPSSASRVANALELLLSEHEASAIEFPISDEVAVTVTNSTPAAGADIDVVTVVTVTIPLTGVTRAIFVARLTTTDDPETSR
jgi:hypothetical protein